MYDKVYWVLNNLEQVGPKFLNKNNKADSKKSLVLYLMREIYFLNFDFAKAQCNTLVTIIIINQQQKQIINRFSHWLKN